MAARLVCVTIKRCFQSIWREQDDRDEEGIPKIKSVEGDGLEEMGQEIGLNQGARRHTIAILRKKFSPFNHEYLVLTST